MPLNLTAVIECEGCGELYEGSWTDDSDTVQDMAENPVAIQTCPPCGHEQEEEFPGFGFRSEAG